MSAALDMAELIRNRLLTPPAPGERATTADLTRQDCIIDRQVPIISLITAALAKATGSAIVILWQGFRVLDGNAANPRLAHRYIITVWSKPIMDAAARPADNIIEAIIQRLWHWVPDGGHAHGEVSISGGDMIPSDEHLIYTCELTIPTTL